MFNPPGDVISIHLIYMTASYKNIVYLNKFKHEMIVGINKSREGTV